MGIGHRLAATSNDIYVFGVSVGRVAMGCHAKILTRALKGEYEYQSHAPAELTWRSLESLIGGNLDTQHTNTH